MAYKFIDLFCGIGGFHSVLRERGLECVFSSDTDPFVQEVYKKNFGEKPQGDITEITENKIPKHDVLCAGAKTGLYNTAQGIRRLTISECKKAMGFPTDHYVSPGTQGYQQLGNAVVPDMIKYVFDGIQV